MSSTDLAWIDWIKKEEKARLAIVWPKGFPFLKGEEDLFSGRSGIVVKYHKTIRITYKGLIALMTQVYEGSPWLGTTENGFAGAKAKATECWDKNGTIDLWLVEENTPKELTECKNELREKLHTEKSALHSTDSREETLHMARLLFNDNTVHMLVNGNPLKSSSLFHKIQSFRSLLKEGDEEHYVLASSTVMGLYALREIGDTDYLSDAVERVKGKDIDDNEKYLKLYPADKESLLYDDGNYLWFWGIKFITLDVLKAFKQKRANNPKDKKDIRLIETVYHPGLSAALFRAGEHLYYLYRTFRHKVKVLLLGK